MDTMSPYSAGQRRLHWLVFLLVAVAYAAMALRGQFERGTLARTLMMPTHFWRGVTVQPVLGLMTAWTDGKQVMLPFGGRVLPALMAPNAALAHPLEDLHKTIGSAFYWIIGFHILAGLYHHFMRKDDTLRRMR